jgi:hypothetical protein
LGHGHRVTRSRYYGLLGQAQHPALVSPVQRLRSACAGRHWPTGPSGSGSATASRGRAGGLGRLARGLPAVTGKRHSHNTDHQRNQDHQRHQHRAPGPYIRQRAHCRLSSTGYAVPGIPPRCAAGAITETAAPAGWVAAPPAVAHHAWFGGAHARRAGGLGTSYHNHMQLSSVLVISRGMSARRHRAASQWSGCGFWVVAAARGLSFSPLTSPFP